MRRIETRIAGACLLEQERKGDERGFFARCFCREELRAMGIPNDIAQANISSSAVRGTLRGLHFQLAPMAETKIVQCVQGRIFDVVLDLRPHGETYGDWIAAELSPACGRMMVVPEGCAHGFLTLEPDCLVHYMVTSAYAPELERGVRFDDPAFAIAWPMEPTVISDRDRSHPLHHMGLDPAA